MGDAGECVKVVVRCRPFNTRERDMKCVKVVKMDKKNLSVAMIRGSEEPKTFTFDNVYDDDSTQKDVYNETAFPLVNSVIEGYNGTIFAYGQTGCGKSFSMSGVPSDPVLRGIIPRSFDQIFEHIATAGAQGASKKFLVAVSYVEIYNEEVRDLLSSNPKLKCAVKEDPEKGVFIAGLTQPEVTSVAEIDRLMNQGNKQRSVGATAMNAESSRSHSLFTVRVETSEQLEGSDEARIKAGKLNLVDLAGSERQSKTEATGDRLKEAQKINLSLSSLGNCISALVQQANNPGKKVFIPYRDSRLTRLLQDSLGGNTKTVMLAAVSPASDNYDETLSTLRYANRAKQIRNKPTVNEDPKDAMLREFQDEIARLKALLAQQGLIDPNTGGVSFAPASEPKKKKRLKAAVQGMMEEGTDEDEEEEEEEEEEEDGQPRVKKAKKKKKQRKPRADGEEEDEEIEDAEDDDEDDDGTTPKRRGKLLDSFASPGERAQFLAEKEAYESQLASLAEEKEKHETFARMLEEQLRVERETMESSIKQQSEAEKAAQLAEIEARLQREKEEHEARARELEEEMARSKAEEAAKLESLQSESLSEKLALKARLKKLQHKLMDGGTKLKTAAQEAEERARLAAEEAVKLRQAEAKEREAKQALEEEKLLLEENYTSVKDEVIGKTKKLRKLKKRFVALQHELDDSKAEWDREREDLLADARNSERSAKLYRQIAAAVLTRSDLQRIVENSVFLEAKDEWQLPRIDLPVFFPTVRALPGATAPPGSKGAGARHGSQDAREPRNPLANTSFSAKFQEEKGADSGWKKSVTAGYKRDEYNPNANGRNVSRNATTASGQRQSPPAGAAASVGMANVRLKTPSGPPVPVPSRLGPMDSSGGGPRTPRMSSPDSSDPLHNPGVARRPAFQGGSVAADSSEDSHARLMSSMESTSVRASFAPGKTQGLASTSPSVDIHALDAKVARKAAFSPSGPAPVASSHSPDPFEALAHEAVVKRPAFAPAGSVPAAAAVADGSIDSLLANAPAPRAAFSPTGTHGGGLSSPSFSASGDDDPFAAAAQLPKRSAFDASAAGKSLRANAAAAPQTSLPSDLPAARSSFQPAFNPSLSSSDPSLDLLSSASMNVPARASFQPAAFTAAPDSSSDLNFPTATRANFQPAHI